MNNATVPSKSDFVINWHITEACNYSCQYCYAKWNKNDTGWEVIHNESLTDDLLRQVATFFNSECFKALQKEKVRWQSVRLNIAGGEPFLYPKRVIAISKAAKDLGMKVSCITNGSRLTPEIISEISYAMSILGISMDSSCGEINTDIGRVDKNGPFSTQNLICAINQARDLNPAIIVKLNTVVNSLNWTEDMNRLISSIAPNRWKVLQVLPVEGAALVVCDREFRQFVARHSDHTKIMDVEDNTTMTESYVMIDPHGRFYQNDITTMGYHYSKPISEVGIEKAFSEIKFRAERFAERYKNDDEPNTTGLV